MAFDTILWNGRGVVANCDALADTAGGTWAELGGGGISQNTDNYLLAPASIGHVYASKDGFGYYTTPATYNFDTGGNEEGQFIYIWIQIQSASAFQLLASNGFSFVVGTDTNNYRTFQLAGSGVGEGKPFDGGGWKLFVFDITKAGSIADVGTFNLATINMMGLWMDTIVSVRADTIFIDQISIGKGLQVTGTGTLSEIIDYCTDYTNRAWGVFQKRGSIGFAYGSLTVGDNVAAAANTTLTDDGTVLEFGFSEFWDGSAWALTHPADYNQINLEKHASFTTDFDVTGTSFFGSLLAKLSFASDAGATASHIGGQLKQLPITTYKTGDILSNIVYSYNEAIKPNGAVFSGNTLGYPVDIINLAAVELVAASDLTNMADLSFNNLTGKYALYIPASITGTITLDNFQSDGSGTDIYWAGTGGTLIVNATNGTNFSTSATGGGTVDIQNAVPITVQVTDNETGLDVPDANVMILKNSDKSHIASGTTNASGLFSTSLNYAGDTDFVGWVRQMDLSGVDYVGQDISGTITTTGASVNVKLVPVTD